MVRDVCRLDPTPVYRAWQPQPLLPKWQPTAENSLGVLRPCLCFPLGEKYPNPSSSGGGGGGQGLLEHRAES